MKSAVSSVWQGFSHTDLRPDSIYFPILSLHLLYLECLHHWVEEAARGQTVPMAKPPASHVSNICFLTHTSYWRCGPFQWRCEDNGRTLIVYIFGWEVFNYSTYETWEVVLPNCQHFQSERSKAVWINILILCYTEKRWDVPEKRCHFFGTNR